MAVNTPRVFTPKMPRFETLSANTVLYRYDRASNIFSAHLRGLRQPAVSIALTDFAYLRLDPVTEEVIGQEVEDFLGYAVFATPAYLDVAAIGGVTPEEIAKVRREIEQRRASDPREQQQQPLDALLASLMQPQVA